MAQSVKIFVSLVISPQKPSVGEEVLNNQVNKLTWCVDVSRPLPEHPVQSGHGGRTGACKWAQ